LANYFEAELLHFLLSVPPLAPLACYAIRVFSTRSSAIVIVYPAVSLMREGLLAAFWPGIHQDSCQQANASRILGILFRLHVQMALSSLSTASMLCVLGIEGR